MAPKLPLPKGMMTKHSPAIASSWIVPLAALAALLSFATPISPADAATTVSITASADTYIYSGSNTTNFGTATPLWAAGANSGKPYRGLMRFDSLTTAIPAGAAVKSATLKCYQTNTTAGRTIEAHRVNTAWVETVVTWKNTWTTQGGDFQATTSTTTSAGANIWLSWDILADVQFWLGGGTNNGTLLKDQTESGTTVVVQCNSREAASNKPTLDVSYLLKVTGLTATAGVSQVSLGWTLPGGSPDYNGTLIIRRAGSAPTWTPTDGTSYSAGTSPDGGTTWIVLNDTTLATAFADTGLTNGTTYYYQAFARDGNTWYSLGSATASATPACAAVSDAGYVAANAQIANGQVNVYWSSANPVVILRKTSAFSTESPTGGTTYSVGNTGGSLGTATVAYVGSVMPFTETPARGSYYYKVFVNASACYSPGTVNTTSGVSVNTTNSPLPPHAWSYAIAGGSTLAASIAGNGTLYTSSNAGRIISLNTVDGTPSWSAGPTATNAAVQSWLSWVPNAWSYRKQITIDPTSTKVSGTLTNFPVLISLTDPDLQSKAQSSGNDIFFTSSDGKTKLSHEIEKYDGVTGTLAAWVKVPSLLSNTVLYMYYGNPAAPGQQSATGVWDANYKGVWHLKDTPTGSAGDVTDSTSNLNNGTSNSMAAADQVAGEISGSLNFDGTNNYVSMGNPASLNLSNSPITIEAWINLGVAQGSQAGFARVVDKWFGTSGGYALMFGSPATSIQLSTTNGTTQDTVSATYTFTAGTWYHVVATWSPSPGSKVLYVNGGQQTSQASGNNSSVNSAANLGLGNTLGGSCSSCFRGKIDEVRISNVARSAGWVSTSYNNQSSPSAFYTVAAEQSLVGGSVIGGDLGTGGANSAQVYFVDSGSGAQTWKAASLTGNGADAIQAAVSAQLWVYSNSAFQSTLQSTYSYSGDVVYVATRNSSRTGNTVYALKATDGTVLWSFNPSTTYNVDQVFGQPYVDYVRNRVYVASKAGVSNNQSNFWIIDSRTGALVQQLALGTNHIQTSPTLSYDGGTVYVGDVTGNLYAVNAAATPPALKWTAPAALGVAIKDTGFVWEDYSTPGRLYFSTGTGATAAVWCWQDPGVGGTPNVTTPCSGWSAVKTTVAGASTPIELNKLFISSWDGTTGRIVQLNPATGAIEQQVTVGDGTKQPGDVSSETGNEIFVGTSDGKIFKFNLTGGSL